MSSIMNNSIVLFVVALIASLQTTSACLCTNTLPNTVANNLEQYPTAIKVWIGQDVSPPAPPCAPGSWCPGSMFRNQYLESYVDVTFKSTAEGSNTSSRGKVIVKNRGFCGAGLKANTNMLLFGTITEEVVEGYFGTIPVFTPSPCAANQEWDSVSGGDQTAIMEYQLAN